MKPSREPCRSNARRNAFSAAVQRTLSACLMAVAVVGSQAGSSPFARAGQERQEHAYAQPLSGLDESTMQRFAAGKAEFAARWVAPFASGGNWGRGPQSNADSCLECHPGNGRGRVPDDAREAPRSLVLRLSVPGTDTVGGPRPHPVYGTQLNTEGILGKLIEEGDFRLTYGRRTVSFADGESVELRVPQVRITALWYGPLGDEAVLSPRVAQPVFGRGLLEAIPQAQINAIADRQRETGIRGRPNYVWERSAHGVTLGRFGHKASQPTLAHQTAAAFITEIGVNSRLFPLEDCWPAQTRCYQLETVSDFEASDHQIASIVDYLRFLAAPEQRQMSDPVVQRGSVLFDRARCSVCHVRTLTTGSEAAEPVLRDRIIHPYTDLLLHDLGDGLADGRSEYLASPRDWRTAPLWGLGLREHVNGNGNLLHDGRARNVTEAILWHQGEAELSRQTFIDMPARDRAALLRFLDSL